MAFDPGNRLIAALDVPDRVEAERFAQRLAGVPSWIKIASSSPAKLARSRLCWLKYVFRSERFTCEAAS